MKIINNTPTNAFYGIWGGGSADCGNIPANGSADRPWYDNKQNVRINLSAVVRNAPPGEVQAFSVTIPKSGKGNTVTFGLFHQ
jgi:hypothetical protein